MLDAGNPPRVLRRSGAAAAAVFLLLLAARAGAAPESEPPSAGAILAAVREAQARDAHDLRAWVFRRTRVRQEPAGEGLVRMRTIEYRVVPRDGFDEEVLLAVNGSPPNEAQLEWMRKKNERRERSARRGRRVEAERPTAGGTGGEEWEEEGERGLEGTLVALLRLSQVRLVGPAVWRGRSAWRLDFEPAAQATGTRGRNEIEKVARAARGTMWLDAEEGRLLRMDATLDTPVRLRGGLVTVRRLEFRFENQRLAPERWFPRLVEYQWEARAGWKTVRLRTTDMFSDFRRATTEIETEWSAPPGVSAAPPAGRRP